MKEWMGRLRTVVVEGKYKEVDRQLKKQFMHGLNDDEMFVETIRKLTKCKENVTILSENVMALAKRIEA